jgi:hypothetical protein
VGGSVQNWREPLHRYLVHRARTCTTLLRVVCHGLSGLPHAQTSHLREGFVAQCTWMLHRCACPIASLTAYTITNGNAVSRSTRNPGRERRPHRGVCYPPCLECRAHFGVTHTEHNMRHRTLRAVSRPAFPPHGMYTSCNGRRTPYSHAQLAGWPRALQIGHHATGGGPRNPRRSSMAGRPACPIVARIRLWRSECGHGASRISGLTESETGFRFALDSMSC